VPPPYPSPDRRTTAGSGYPHEERAESGAPYQPRAFAPDMERALGALRDFTRRDILLRFYSDHKPRSVDDVADVARVHRSVAFDHLERLVALGYLEVERRRGFPGKPAKIYRLTAGPVQISHPARRFDVLAEAVARALVEVTGADAKEAMRRAGRSLGQSLARRGVTSIAAALEPLKEMGGDYEIERAGRISCTNCLFAEVCRRVPGVCDLHAGVIEGLCGRDGLRAGIEALGFQGASGCAYHVSD
jgi:predicted ArsR family transcriptional regulator